MEVAFASLRAYARSHNERLAEVAHALVARELSIDAVTGGAG